MTTIFNARLQDLTYIRECWPLLLPLQIQQRWLEKRVSRSPSQLVLTTGQQVAVQRALTDLQRDQRTLITEVGQGVEHFCFKVHEVPGIIFKRSRYNFYYDESAARCKCAVYETAAQICETFNLYFLQVPQCHYIKSDSGEYFLMQEELTLLPVSVYEAYKHAFKELSQETCLLELYNQLILFITASNYSDANLGNMPFTPNGLIALIDLDAMGANTGHLSSWVACRYPEFMKKTMQRA